MVYIEDMRSCSGELCSCDIQTSAWGKTMDRRRSRGYEEGLEYVNNPNGCQKTLLPQVRYLVRNVSLERLVLYIVGFVRERESFVQGK